MFAHFASFIHSALLSSQPSHHRAAATCPEMQPTQAFRCRSSGKIVNIETFIDPKSGERIVLWKDVQRAFKNAESIWKGSCMLSFLKDENFEEITPWRTAYYPDHVLEVDRGDTSQVFHSRETSIAAHPETFYALGEPTHHDTKLGHQRFASTADANTQVRFIDTPAIAETNTMNQDAQSMALVPQNQTPYPIMQYVDHRFERLQVEIDKNRQLQGQLVQMQQHMDTNQQQMYQLQKDTGEEIIKRQQEMLRMQQQALDRLAIIQSSMQALVTQTYELHEYPIPRLFIVLPKTLGLSGKIKSLISDQFRLYFMCECGSHTMSDDLRMPHQIHLAKHEGYDLEKPTVFFERYGSYVLTLMHMIKYGITAAGLIVPPLANSKIVEGLESAQKHMDYLKKNIAPLVDDTIKFLSDIKSNQKMGEELGVDHVGFDQLEALEGADLRQLESYLKVKDKGRVLGNLYRIVTSEGHVKWVCFDHYRASYREVAIKQLQEIVTVNSGTYVEETGSIEIKLATSTQAKQFYEAMEKARCIQELEITFGWDATMDDLRQFAKAVTKANVVSLTVNGTYLKSPALDVVNRTRRFDPIMQLTSNARIQSLRIKDFNDFFARVSKSSWILSPVLRVLSLQPELPLQGKDKSIGSLFRHYPGLTTLEVKLNHWSSITEAALDFLNELPRLESLKADCGTISVAARIVKGNVQNVVLTMTRPNDLALSDLEEIQRNISSKLLIKFMSWVEDVDRLPDAFQPPEFNHIRIGNKNPAILASHEWKLQDLVEIATSETEGFGVFSINCERLTLTSDVADGEIQNVVLNTTRLSDLLSDDLAVIELGYLARLRIGDTPLKADEARLARILNVNMTNLHLQIGSQQRRPPGSKHLMKLWDIVKMAASNALCRIESLKIDYWNLSVITGVSQGQAQDVILTVDKLRYIDFDGLDTIQLDTFPKVLIKYRRNESGSDMLARFSYIQLERSGEQHLVITAPGRKLQDVVDTATTETLEGSGSFSIGCPRLSLNACFSEGKPQDMTMTIQQLYHLNSEDLAYIQQGHLTGLIIMHTPKDKEKDRLADVLRCSQALKRFEIKDQRKQDPSIRNASEIGLLNLVSLVTSNTSSSVESCSIDYQRLSWTTVYSDDGNTMDEQMTVMRISDLNSDDLAYILHGRLSRLTIIITMSKGDMDVLGDLLHRNQVLDHLELKYEAQSLALGRASEMRVLDFVTFVTSNVSSKLGSFLIDHPRFSLSATVTHGKIKGLSMKIEQFSNLTSDDLAVLEHRNLVELMIVHTPVMTDVYQFSRLLKVSRTEFHLQIGRKGQHQPAGKKLEMKLWDIVKLATTIDLCRIESMTIDCWMLSVTTGVYQGEIKDVLLKVKDLGDLLPRDLDAIRWGNFSKLLIEYTSRKGDEDRLNAITRARVSCIQFKSRGTQGRIIVTTPKRKLQDLLEMALNELTSFSIICPRLSMHGDFPLCKGQGLRMTIERLDHLTSDDLSFIQQGHLSQLSIIQDPQEGDEGRLTEIRHSSPSLIVVYLNQVQLVPLLALEPGTDIEAMLEAE
ncbi:MAG: hypothetical protein J3Q66DRAFT_437962 [Benniella sp.]|nr:MAG: hypothetical protein J3Q66DRAFT_437962 [Benniella sp.]